MKVKLRKILSLALSISLLFQQIGFAQIATELNLANHFARMASSFTVEKFRPLHLRYFSYDSLNDNFKLLLDKGDLKNIGDKELQSSTQALLSYFLVGVTLPDSMFWVNLRPDSEDQIIDQYLEKTDVGKIMLAADLQLKKDTAAMTSPATPEGKEYWDRLYKKAAELYGYDNVSIPTLTRPWIVPGEIIVRESQDSAYVYKANLKVMLEQDYLKASSNYNFKDSRSKALNEYSSELIRELIIPKLTKEVNSSKRYAPLRQVYYSLILARWFKLRFSGKTGTYASLINTRNLTNLISRQPWSKTDYFKQYQKSFADGEYNIKEPVYTPTGQVIRSYFSGGIVVDTIKLDSFINKAMPGKLLDDGFLMKGDSNGIKVTASPLKNPDNKRVLSPNLSDVAFTIAIRIGLGTLYGPGEKGIRDAANKFIRPLVEVFRLKLHRDPTDNEAKNFYDSVTTGLSQDAGRTVNNGKGYISAEAETFATDILKQENPSKPAAGSLEQESNSSSVSSLENQAYLLALTLGIKDSERKYAAKVIMVPLIKAFIDNSNPTPTSSQAKEFYQRIINNTDRTVSVEVLARSFAFLSNPNASLPEKEKSNSSSINIEEVKLIREREKIKEKIIADLNARFDQRFKDNDPTAVDEIIEYNARLSTDERQALYEWLQFHESKLTADAIAKIGFNWLGIVAKLMAKSRGFVKGNPRSAARQLHELAKDGTYAGVRPPVDLADKIITEAKLAWQAHPELEKLLEYKQSPEFPKLQAKRAGILVLIRHGETVRSEAVLNKWAGWADAPITENGKREAFVAGGRLKGVLRFDKAYSSDLSRAKDTLTQILRATEQSDVPVFVREEIRERDYGDMIGWRRSSVQEIFGEGVYKGWRRGYSGNAERPAGGENLKDVLERSLPVFIGEIMQDIAEGKNVIVSAHGNSLRSMLIALRGHTNDQPLTEDEIRKLEVGLSTPIVITFDGELRHKELLVDVQKNPADVSAFLESQGVPSETSAEKGTTSSTVTLSGEDKVKIQAALEKYNIYYMDSRLESEFSQRIGKGESSDSIVDFIDFISKIYGNRQSLVNALKILLSCQGSLRDIQSLINNEKYLRPSEILNLLSFYGRLLPLDIIRETVASEKESRPPEGSEAELKLPRLYDLVFNRLQEKSKSTSSALVTPLQKAEEIAGILLESDNLPPEKLSKAILITEIASVVEKFRKDLSRDPTPFEVSQVIYQTRSITTIQAKSVKSTSSAVQNIEELIRRNDKTELRSLLEDATVTSGTLMPVPETSGILGPGSINLDNSDTYYNGEAEFDPLFDKMVEVARKLNRPDILVLVIQRLREISAELEKKEMREHKNLIPNVYSSEAGLTARIKDTVLDRIAQLEENEAQASSAVTEEKIKEKFRQAKLPLNEYYMGYIVVSLSSIFKDGDDIDRDTAADILISVYDNNKGTGETRALNQVIMTLNNAIGLKKIVKYIRDHKDKPVASSAVEASKDPGQLLYSIRDTIRKSDLPEYTKALFNRRIMDGMGSLSPELYSREVIIPALSILAIVIKTYQSTAGGKSVEEIINEEVKERGWSESMGWAAKHLAAFLEVGIIEKGDVSETLRPHLEKLGGVLEGFLREESGSASSAVQQAIIKLSDFDYIKAGKIGPDVLKNRFIKKIEELIADVRKGKRREFAGELIQVAIVRKDNYTIYFTDKTWVVIKPQGTEIDINFRCRTGIAQSVVEAVRGLIKLSQSELLEGTVGSTVQAQETGASSAEAVKDVVINNQEALVLSLKDEIKNLEVELRETWRKRHNVMEAAHGASDNLRYFKPGATIYNNERFREETLRRDTALKGQKRLDESIIQLREQIEAANTKLNRAQKELMRLRGQKGVAANSAVQSLKLDKDIFKGIGMNEILPVLSKAIKDKKLSENNNDNRVVLWQLGLSLSSMQEVSGLNPAEIVIVMDVVLEAEKNGHPPVDYIIERCIEKHDDAFRAMVSPKMKNAIKNHAIYERTNRAVLVGGLLNYGRYLELLEDARDIISDAIAVSSSPMIQGNKTTVGGIDFRALPMTIQPMGSFTGLNFKLPQLSQAQLKQINIDSEMQQVKNLVESGIVPSGDRIKELIAACSQKGEISYYVDNLLLCLVDICKLEEQNAFETSPELREALAIVDSLGGQV